MSLKDEQIEREHQYLAIKAKNKIDFIESLNRVQLEFNQEINLLAENIVYWRQHTRTPSKHQEIAYTELIDKIPAEQMAEILIRGIFEAIMIAPANSPMPSYQNIVNGTLIPRRLRSALPSEERAIEPQYKFLIIDRYVTKAINLLPSLFIEAQDKNKKGQLIYYIKITEKAQKRLSAIPTRDLLLDSPMFYRPEPWTSIFNGGFLTPEAQRGNPLISSYRLSYNDLRLIDRSLQENPEILNAVNKMQNVGFRIEENYEKYQQIIASVRKEKIAECDRKINKYAEEIATLKAEIAAQEAV